MINNIIILILIFVFTYWRSVGVHRSLNDTSSWVSWLNGVGNKWWNYYDSYYSTTTSKWCVPGDFSVDWSDVFREWSTKSLGDSRIPQRHFCPFDEGVWGYRYASLSETTQNTSLFAPIIPTNTHWEYYFSYNSKNYRNDKRVKSVELFIGNK